MCVRATDEEVREYILSLPSVSKLSVKIKSKIKIKNGSIAHLSFIVNT